MSREGYYLPEVGIVYENSELITEGPMVEILREAKRLYESGDIEGFSNSVFENPIYQNLSDKEKRILLLTENIYGQSSIADLILNREA